MKTSAAQIVADDWVCTNAALVTDIHWWGSFIGWSETQPPMMPYAFNIMFWTDVPAGGQPPWSHPGVFLRQIICTNFTWHFVGWDLDPRNPTAPLEACFKFEQDLTPEEWFHQGPGTNIYWISIAAIYTNQIPTQYAWGWKTRPRDTNSLAPDDAVRMGSQFPFGSQPIEYPAGVSWDAAFMLTTRASEEQDFGDAPDPNYPTLLSSIGARHFIVPGFSLGAKIDAEADGLPDPLALGDDNNNSADEDGVAFTQPWLAGTQACVNVGLASPWGTGQLDGWVDFNKNGVWELGEQVFNSFPLLSGPNTNLCFNVPTIAVLGPTFARFRLSSVGGLLPTGAASDGEVEDYRVVLAQRRPPTNLVITVTNILVTPTNVTIGWAAQTNVHYQLQATLTLSNAPAVTWTNIGSEIIGPANSQTDTNAAWPELYYRVVAPYVWP